MAERTIPPTGALAIADHELAARLARGWVLQQRTLRSQRDVHTLVEELASWNRSTQDVLVRRAGGIDIADAYDDASGPLVRPDPRSPIADQASLLQAQLELRLRWLSELRDELPERVDLDELHDEIQSSVGPLLVLRGASSQTGDAAASALDALGWGVVREVVVEEVLDLAEAQEGRAAIVVVDRFPRTDRATTASALALGWALGRLGPDRVLAVVTRGVDPSPLGDTVATVVTDSRRRWRTEVVAWAAAATRP
jgi:hypothetical protein